MSDTDYRKIYIDQVELVKQKTKIIDGCIKIIQKRKLYNHGELDEKELFNEEVLEYDDFKSMISRRRQIENLYSAGGEHDDLLKVKTERIKLHIEEFLLIFETVSRSNGFVDIAQILQDTKPNNISENLIDDHKYMIKEILDTYGGVINKKKQKKKRKSKKRKSNKKRNKTKKSKK